MQDLIHFHQQLSRYSAVYTVNIHNLWAIHSIAFRTYLHMQYNARARRLTAQQNVPRKAREQRLLFSPHVYAAIERTGWRPSTTVLTYSDVGSTSMPADWRLEIVHVMAQAFGDATVTEYYVIEQMNYDTRMLAVPLFVITPDDDIREYITHCAVALDEAGTPTASYEYEFDTGLITSAVDPKSLMNVFTRVITHPQLMSAGRFLRELRARLNIGSDLLYDDEVV
jgi:hypothetical protein